MSVFPVPPPRSVHAPPLSEHNENPFDRHGVQLDDLESDDILRLGEWRVGQRYYGVDAFVEYIAGNLPIIITVPHGGYATGGIPDRVGGVHEPDIHTQELARMIHQAFAEQLGRPDAQPHMVINRLRRGKLDMNRNEEQATMGHPLTRKAWRQFNAFVRRAKREIVRGRSITRPGWSADATDGSEAAAAATAVEGFSRGLCLDLHGQSHDHRHQLGYILNQTELSSLSDSMLDSSLEMVDKCSMRVAVDPAGAAAAHAAMNGSGSGGLGHPRNQSPTLLSQIVRGQKSLGHMLEALGHPCVPSPSSPHAGLDVVYFNAGYNTYVNGSSCIGAQQRKKEMAATRDAAAAAASNASCCSLSDSVGIPMSALDPDPSFTFLFDTALVDECFLAIQAETAYEGQRDSEENMRVFANNFAKALCQFIDLHVLKEGECLPQPLAQPTASTSTSGAEMPPPAPEAASADAVNAGL